MGDCCDGAEIGADVHRTGPASLESSVGTSFVDIPRATRQRTKAFFASFLRAAVSGTSSRKRRFLERRGFRRPPGDPTLRLHLLARSVSIGSSFTIGNERDILAARSFAAEVSRTCRPRSAFEAEACMPTALGASAGPSQRPFLPFLSFWNPFQLSCLRLPPHSVRPCVVAPHMEHLWIAPGWREQFPSVVTGHLPLLKSRHISPCFG
jgi:hypothetical protein